MLQPSDYIAAASAVVAICALAVSFWQGYVARAHARLSVRPHVEVHFDVRQQGSLTIEVVNTGIGPAFIERLTVRFGEDVVTLVGADDSRRLARLLAGDVPEYNLQFFVLDAATAVPAGARIKLLEVEPLREGIGPWMSSAQATIKLLGSLSAESRYRCIYGTHLESRSGRSAA